MSAIDVLFMNRLLDLYSDALLFEFMESLCMDGWHRPALVLSRSCSLSSRLLGRHLGLMRMGVFSCGRDRYQV